MSCEATTAGRAVWQAPPAARSVSQAIAARSFHARALVTRLSAPGKPASAVGKEYSAVCLVAVRAAASGPPSPAR